MSIEDEQKRFQEEGREGEIFGEYLMRTAARREIEFLAAQLAAERKDNERLRGLIKEVEHKGSANRCPWCGAWEDAPHESATMLDEGCPAFYGPALPWVAGKVR